MLSTDHRHTEMKPLTSMLVFSTFILLLLQASYTNSQQTETPTTTTTAFLNQSAEAEATTSKVINETTSTSWTTKPLYDPDPSSATEQKSATVLSGQEGPPKTAPILRPSIEEVASDLSRKHLNLEHRNWRLNRSSQVSQRNKLIVTTSLTNENITKVSAPEAEQSIMYTDTTEQAVTSGSTLQQEQEQEGFFKKLTERYHDQYLHIDATPLVNQPRNKAPSSSQHRRKKVNNLHYEDNELYQCHQYLRHHSSPVSFTSGLHSTASSASQGLSGSGQQLPCSCDFRDRDFYTESTSLDSVWLSCDNVQLIGSYFYTPVADAINASDLIDDNITTGSDNVNNKSIVVTRFSQRNSGLQTLHSQKFHYLQLIHLKSIDLSNNRIRHLKMDAFHGLEFKLEHLNLANNLLGDFRATFDRAQNSNLHNGKFIFFGDELNRLKRLKWLSIRNNQINQLAPDVFVRTLAQVQAENTVEFFSELSYLDLSENLLKFIPSDAIRLLNKLQTLKLKGNRITQLDRQSKFPKSLKYLDLSENSIKIIRQCDLIDLPNLIELDLSRNQLSRLDKTAFISSSGSLSNNLLQTSDSVTLSNLHLNEDNQSYLFGEAYSKAHKQNNDNKSSDSSATNSIRQRRRKRRDIKVVETMDDNSPAGDVNFEADDLESEESILLSMSNQVSGRQAISDELSFVQKQNQFNSTRKLNLSYNLFENIPGDSLLKFSNLQQLDLSFNRIRHLDSNYLCSIFNLVENLRLLDLSGNLFSLSPTGTSASDNGNSKHLNRLLSCIQKLEKLLLSTNRLGELDIRASTSSSLSWTSDDNRSGVISDEATEHHPNVGETKEASSLNDRLLLKFGEGLGSRYLNTLDLSDNQLKLMPIIQQVSQPIIVSASTTNNSNITNQQSKLSQWMSSRVNLEILNLNFNYLEKLEEHEFEHIYNLRELHLDFNKISELPVEVMRRFISLDRLSLNGNRISSLSPLNELFERSLRTLKTLDLSNNRLMEWPKLNKLTTTVEGAAISNYNQESKQNLTPFFVGGVDERPLKALTFALEELSLAGNLLTSGNVTSLFDQLAHMQSLKVMNLNYNLLNKIKSEWFKFANGNLQTLSLASNRINNIELGSFALNQVNELVDLNLEHNLLKELKRKTFDSMPKIRKLNLANNLIHTINSETFHQVYTLQVLRLNHNKLTSWKCEYFSNLCNSISGNINADLATLVNSHRNEDSAPPASVSSLVELDLGYNSLSQLRANSISVHTKLNKLNLEHNKLSFIPHDLFRATTSGSTTGRQIQLISSLKYLNLAHNRIQTIDNINFRPLKNLLSLDLSFNELQTLGIDLVLMDSKHIQQEQNNRNVIVSNNVTNLLVDEDMLSINQAAKQSNGNRFLQSATNWPALSKLRYLNLANNQLTSVNQSLLSELSPTALLNLNLSANYLDSESLPYGFYTKITASPKNGHHQVQESKQASYDLMFTLKLESLDLSYNRLNEFPANLLDNHYSSMESCNLSHNRIHNLDSSNMMIQIKSLNLEFNPLNRESNELILFEQRNVRYLNMAATRLYAIQQATLPPDPSIKPYSASQFKYRLVNQTSQLDLIRSISRPIDAPYLRHLNLSSNQLVWLAANVFDKMHSLQTLDLSNNQLTRLHLLNNQLSHVSSSLEYLNMASNLFTNIDSNDFSQLQMIQHLDLSNLLSLQKMNCQFLSKLTTVKTLKLFNYPQLRHSLSNLVNNLNSVDSERLKQRLRNELIMSTIGKHCFQDETLAEPLMTSELSSYMSDLKWFNLQKLELELFNNFEETNDKMDGAFVLRDELAPLLGPQLKELTLIGLNFTKMSDNSLLGITSEDFKLKISYTSMFQLPMRQLQFSASRRTKLDLDFRHNNIQTIDMKDLQLLDDLQLNNQAFQSTEHSSLKLSSNPIRCDCQTRPLWLWLNQRWGKTVIDHANLGADDTGNSDGSVNNANYWLKFNSISHTSDLKCYYPLKLRGKLTQHVYYNDLVCKGASGSTNRQSKRRNETRPIESYYISAMNGESGDLDDSDDDEYPDTEQRSDNYVKITRFNRYPPVRNTLQHLLNTFTVPFIQDKSEPVYDDNRISKQDEYNQNRIGKRDENSLASAPIPVIADIGGHVSTNYSKHRPNVHQRHSHFNTILPLGNSFQVKSSSKHSFLTESDIWILTVASIAMSIMSFVIIAICLFKYKLDQNDKDQALDNHGKLILSQALLMNSINMRKLSKLERSVKNSQSSSTSSKKSSNSDKSSKTNKNLKSVNLTYNKPFVNQPVLVPVSQMGIMAAGTQNFLMRSPTIRRMHGLASNASDWFRFTLRAYPASGGDRRGRLFTSNSNIPSGSQLSTSKPITSIKLKPDCKQLLPSALAAGCPIHAFRCVRKLQDPARRKTCILAPHDVDCQYCARLLAAMQQTKVQLPVTSVVHELPVTESKLSSRETDTTTTEDKKKHSEQTEVPILELIDERVNKDKDVQTGLSLTVEQQNYIPPGLIKALAKQLDKRKMTDSGSWHQRRTSAGTYRSRSEQQTMRTFGSAAQTSSNTMLTSEKTADHTIESQIPTIDVDGRFTYQPESQLESPTGSQRKESICEQELFKSAVTSGEDIFILMHDSDAEQPQITDTVCPEQIEIAPIGAHSNSQTEVGSLMNDECSHSSSPIAYGFMRSSPSATTLSSATATHNQYVVNRSSDRLNNVPYNNQAGRCQYGYNNENGSTFINNSTIKNKMNISNSNNNNNADLKLLERKEIYRMEASDGSISSNTDDHVIISRL